MGRGMLTIKPVSGLKYSPFFHYLFYSFFHSVEVHTVTPSATGVSMTTWKSEISCLANSGFNLQLK